MAGLYWGMSSAANATVENVPVPVLECMPVAAAAKSDPDVDKRPLRPAIGAIYVPSMDTYLRDGADLREMINNAYAAVDSEHRAMTNCWRTPLSLFGEEQANAATNRGVPNWAVANVFKAQKLIDQVSGLTEQKDVYDSQLANEKKGSHVVNRVAVLKFLEQFNDLASRLHAHLPLVQQAREIFDNPKIVTTSEDPYKGNKDVNLDALDPIKTSNGKSLTKMVFGGLFAAAGVAASIVLDTTLDVMAGKTANGTLADQSSPQEINTNDHALVDPVIGAL